MFVAALDHVYELSERTWAELLAGVDDPTEAAERVLDYEASHHGEFGLYRIVFAGLSETDDPEIAAGHDVDAVVPGGSSRSGSVRSGLAAVPADVDVVLVHDAARPGASPELFRRVIAAIENGADAVVPGVAVVDTIKRVDAAGRVLETLDRSELVRVQTPQVFRAAALRKAHATYSGVATDDASMIEGTGGTVGTFPGSPANIKITYEHDLAVAATLLTAQEAT